MTAWLVSRVVAGMPWIASDARPLDTPGMIRKKMPASLSARASSPPRPKMNGSPPFSRSTRRPALRQRDQPVGDVGLRDGGAAAALARIFERRVGTGERENARIDQRVVDDHVGARQRVQGVKGQQAGIAGPRADEPDGAPIERMARDASCSRQYILGPEWR